MTARIVTWEPGIESLGRAVVAIGVFDGVHIGHQALLTATVADARAREVQAVAVTFDRDPDQIVSPQTAAPQLLTLPDKLRVIGEFGIDCILVVPFTSRIAELAPESFLDSVLLSALTPVAIHVGSDFRFGRMATGDVSTLRSVGAMRGIDIVPHDLVTLDGAPVTSTRIRSLVAAGKIAETFELLGGRPCVAGTVRRGRGEGAGLGFPTANVEPVEFAALPGDGVYAGRAVLQDGVGWAAAISVGTPPMFPQAKDYLEAHLIGFEGDLYGQPIELEFWDRLRDQQPYPDIEALKAAIAADVDQALEIAGFTDEELAESDADGEATDAEGPAGYDEESDADEIADPAALEAAEIAAMLSPGSFDTIATGEWEPVASRQFNILAAGAEAYALAAPLEAANIPYYWDPYPPEQAPGAMRGAFTRDFTLLVPVGMLEEATAILDEAEGETDITDADAQLDAVVDDPAALEAAEQAAQNYRAPQDDTHDDEEWSLLLADMPFDKQRFLQIDAALFSADIEHVWEPYAPQDAPLIRISFFDIERFSVSVFESDLGSAQRLLGGLREESDDWGEHW